jgi:RNA polymerase sigma-70 factor (ECF subfamily)
VDVETDDATLLHRWRDGDKRSGHELFERYYALVARFFSNKVTSDRADLVQATFAACVEKADQLREATSFRSFLFGIARFELLHHYRRKSQRETEFDPADLSVCDLDPSPSRLIAEHQEQRLLLEALRRIPLELQMVLELSYWERLTAVEIAEVLGIPEGTVKSRIRRARERLDITLGELADSPRLLESTMANLDGWAAQLRDVLGRPPQ